MNIHSIIIADTGDAFQIGVVLEERNTRTKTAETTSYLCAFYDPNHQDGDVPMTALIAEKDLKQLDVNYRYGADAFLANTPAFEWAQNHVARLEAPAPTPASDADTLPDPNALTHNPTAHPLPCPTPF